MDPGTMLMLAQIAGQVASSMANKKASEANRDGMQAQADSMRGFLGYPGSFMQPGQNPGPPQMDPIVMSRLNQRPRQPQNGGSLPQNPGLDWLSKLSQANNQARNKPSQSSLPQYGQGAPSMSMRNLL